MRRVLAGGLSALALAACAVGPTYRAPAPAPSARGALVESRPGLTAEEAPPPDWWRLYSDPVLDALVAEALTHNRDLQAAAANLAYARAVLQEARAGLYPTTDLAAGASYGKRGGSAAGGAGSGAGGASPKARWTYDAGLDVGWQLDLFGRLRRGIEAARADAAAQAAALDYARVTVAAETTRAYVSACALAQQLSVARQSVALVQQTYALQQTRARLGAASDYDLARQGALLASAEAAIPALEGQRRAALYSLAALTGRPPAEVPAAAQGCQAAPALTQPLPVGDGASLLRRRPDVREAERQLAAATARIGVAVSLLYPSVSLSGSVSAAASRVGDLGRSAATSYSLGPLISWTFPNTLVAQARIREARASASGAYARWESTVLSALRDTETALSTYAAELDRNRQLRAARDQDRRAYELAQIRFRAGAISALDLLDVQRTLIADEASLAQSDATLAADQVQVFLELGGGWEQAPVTPVPQFP